MTEKQLKWLRGKLDEWQQEDVLDAATADRLLEKAESEREPADSSRAVQIFSLFGGLLIGLGIITLLAYNWQSLTRPMRVVVAYIPLLLALGLTGWMLGTGRRSSIAWREGLGAFHVAAVGATISLIAQTYHIPGAWQGFFLTWALLILPLVYLTGAGIQYLAYLAGITAWFLGNSWQGDLWITGIDGVYWILIGLVVPFAWQGWRTLEDEEKWQRRSRAGISWPLAAAVTLAASVTLIGRGETAGAPLLAAWFSGMFLFSWCWLQEDRPLWQDPWRVIGAVGVLVIALVFSYRRDDPDFGGWDRFGPTGVAVAVLTVAGWAWISFRALTKESRNQLLTGGYALFPVLVFLAVILGSGSISMIGFNILILALGIFSVVDGARDSNLTRLNWGLILISVLVILRFFDSDLSFLVKGIGFILIGTGFLVANLMIARSNQTGKEANR